MTYFAPGNWLCIDCGFDTAPGFPNQREVEQLHARHTLARDSTETKISAEFNARCEVYHVRKKVWAAAKLGPLDGCLCIGCLEKRIRRQLKPEDFPPNHPFNSLPGTARLEARRSGAEVIRYPDGSYRFPDGERCEDDKALAVALMRRRSGK